MTTVAVHADLPDGRTMQAGLHDNRRLAQQW